MILSKETPIDWESISRPVGIDPASEANLVFNCATDGSVNNAYVFTTVFENLFLYCTDGLGVAPSSTLSLLLLDQYSNMFYYKHRYSDCPWTSHENHRLWLHHMGPLMTDIAFRKVMLLNSPDAE